MGTDVDIPVREAIPFLDLVRHRMPVAREDGHCTGDVLALAAMQVVRDPGAAPVQKLEQPQGYL